MSDRCCSSQSLDIDEPLLGTAGSAEIVVGIAWPKPCWHPHEAALSRGLPPEIAQAEARAKAGGRTLQLRVFQRAPACSRDAVELVCVDFARGTSLQQMGVPVRELAARIERFAASGAPEGPPCAPQLWVCTDGKHDRCCAEHGHAVFEAMRNAVSRRGLALPIAEASHLGGHRFAATCLVLPSGELYGRVRPEDAQALVAAAASGRIHATRFRGRSGRGEIEQLAEAAAHAAAPETTGIRIEAVEEHDGRARVRVRAQAPFGSRALSVRLRAREFASAASCGDPAPFARRHRWILESVEACPESA